MSVLFLAVAVFFGLRWFTMSGTRIVHANLSPTWPPPNSINVCPDFLSLRSDVDGNKTTYYCVDPLGVTTKAGTIQQWSSSGTAATQFQLGSVTTASTNGTTTIPASTDWHNVNKLCADANVMGLTWEGVCIPGSGNVQLPTGVSLPMPV